MTGTPDRRVDPLLKVLSSEVISVTEMLLRYEEAVDNAEIKHDRPKQSLQDFDLALQILGDLKSAIDQIGSKLPENFQTEEAFSPEGMKLQRLRERFSSVVDRQTPSAVNQPRNIEFF